MSMPWLRCTALALLSRCDIAVSVEQIDDESCPVQLLQVSQALDGPGPWEAIRDLVREAGRAESAAVLAPATVADGAAEDARKALQSAGAENFLQDLGRAEQAALAEPSRVPAKTVEAAAESAAESGKAVTLRDFVRAAARAESRAVLVPATAADAAEDAWQALQSAGAENFLRDLGRAEQAALAEPSRVPAKTVEAAAESAAESGKAATLRDFVRAAARAESRAVLVPATAADAAEDVWKALQSAGAENFLRDLGRAERAALAEPSRVPAKTVESALPGFEKPAMVQQSAQTQTSDLCQWVRGDLTPCLVRKESRSLDPHVAFLATPREQPRRPFASSWVQCSWHLSCA
ncbi:unnamed protein product [Effrenium voratum]|uniref:Uncharacterized protein n=1 Tax=Effrenium voratum TaxID=2562239 RepID=A0AA36N9C2_9DINO|nr:unnamed protein product [Effrenium voratum]